MACKADPCDENEEVPTAKSIITKILDLPPSCIEVSPLNPHLFIIGTYFLHPETDKGQYGDSETARTSTAGTLRSGSLILGSIGEQGTDVAFADHDLQSSATSTTNRDKAQSSRTVASLGIAPFESFPTPYAVLDLHFSPHEPSTFAVATSTGAICLFLLDQTNGAHLVSLKAVQITDPSVLVLSLAFKPSSSILAVSLSTGQIAIFDHKMPHTTLRMVEAHSLEAWMVAWSVLPGAGGATVLYSGGDDSALCRHGENLLLQNLQVDEDNPVENAYEPMSRDTKTHGAGVTAILPVPVSGASDQELLLTGSYDEHIRLLEPASTRRRSKVLAEKRLGGGVWRLKLLRKVDRTLGGGMRMIVLASCMHAGAGVLKISQSSEEAWTILTMTKFEEHESMNYASDACTQLDHDLESLTVLSTSFYDEKLCVWSTKDHD